MAAITSDGLCPAGHNTEARPIQMARPRCSCDLDQRTYMPQALVIFDASREQEALSGAAGLVNVTQRLPPRLAIIEGLLDRIASLRDVPGVVGVFEGPVSETALKELSPTERLFAEAWASSRRPKLDRRGQGLAWDAEGFEPPNGKKEPS
jgi:hypothetical protein